MSKYLWTRAVVDGPLHMVRESTDQTHTLCGLFVLQEAWDGAVDELGNERPCDNCSEIAARHEDAGDQPEVESPGVEFDGIPD